MRSERLSLWCRILDLQHMEYMPRSNIDILISNISFTSDQLVLKRLANLGGVYSRLRPLEAIMGGYSTTISDGMPP